MKAFCDQDWFGRAVTVIEELTISDDSEEVGTLCRKKQANGISALVQLQVRHGVSV